MLLRVARKWHETPEIACFELRDTDGQLLPEFTAGAHVDVHPPGGFVRQYSLCNNPVERERYVIGILREPSSRGGSASMHDHVTQGDLLRVSSPRNHFGLAESTGQHVLLGGGIGITPLLAMAEQLAADGADFELHHCARSRGRTPFVDRLRRSAFATRVHHHFDDQSTAQRLDLSRILGASRPGVHLYVCGPGGFMDWVLDNARQARWPDAQCHSERFAAVGVPMGNGSSFEVLLARSGRIVEVPAQSTIVNALTDVGVDVPVSCGEGLCGTCLTRVIDGTPDHRDLFLSAEERARNDQMTLCCSRSKSARLTLDL